MASFRETQKSKQTTQEEPKTLEQLQGMNQTELMQALLAERDKAKANGTLDEASIQRFWETVSPSLDDAQRKKMQELLALLR